MGLVDVGIPNVGATCYTEMFIARIQDLSNSALQLFTMNFKISACDYYVRDILLPWHVFRDPTSVLLSTKITITK
jgi:hypothetical protein